ncbi:L-ornithine 5-monooxygenase [Cupriavidus necator]|uniref:Lysine/ornithine N-monooxygenase n=1 Tax=Cupriavidus necator (strain ATCC 17699 / DSM 428 / KCTC 22496 / NCIMB 10442 / H16 / Stanier 337) TaxID=381666 RepID=Q0K0K9_CUPNH|nr:lysine N(6)-hydroxylase/L-ornithine N(5)-oxygenase family protein [Cupriavidus necator]QCC04298.1 ornithine monooxygenase [Cupriavidus necator H16]QQB78987.1 lysine N(6)-hydroxylase/L-ornithine N(5)-oxygenase family protein [Cupriavidus necator]WKA43207.1 lysine N(6)-hydroxylase/L-ornithine N(5)-oxygenase family protein [Cupriavidus necator]CAJ96465.1 Lysine/ornithine N-monooxygenase [Cupriavidus necator H16]
MLYSASTFAAHGTDAGAGPVLDLLGIGFGPSNLALAVALREMLPQQAPFRFGFVEKKPGFVWHGNMLLDNSRMQISFLKDLVTMRNPASRYTFINYLHERERLLDFINTRTFYPSRYEFNDYLSWVAGDFADACHYGEEVVSVAPEPAGGNGDLACLRVTSRTAEGALTERRARNVVVSVGGAPSIPDAFVPLRGHPRVFHSSSYLESLERLERTAPVRRVAVIGSGQSAAEIFLDLHGREGGIAVDLVSRVPALKPADDSPFVNEIFNPRYIDYLFSREATEREQLLREFGNTNYAVVDTDLIEAIYEVLYQQKVTGKVRHRLLAGSEARHAEADADGVRLDIARRDDGAHQLQRYDAVILATGYRRELHQSLLAPLASYLDDAKGFQADRDYRLQMAPGCQAGVFLQGCCEATHGLSDTLLSVLAVRAQEIAAAVLGNRAGAACAMEAEPPRSRPARVAHAGTH